MNYYSLNEYCKKEYGHKLYKLSLDGGMTCPNRDGKIGTGGCIFCSEEGSGEFAAEFTEDIYSQIEKAKAKVSQKNKSGRYIAYFQSFTNTYAPVKYLKKIFTEAINHPDIDILSIATRPDCLGDDVIDLLTQLNKIKPVWIELGLQTSNEKTAEYIRRCYDNEIYKNAVKKLSIIGIKTVTHIILGLPHETREDMEKTVKFAVDCGTWGVKLHLLYVLKDTYIAKEYEKGKFSCLTKEEYISIVCRLIQIMPPDTVIHRLTGDGAKKKLIAPVWSANKKDVLNSLNAEILQKGIHQGDLYNN